MADYLLIALVNQSRQRRNNIKRDFNFRHGLSHDFESLIWVVVYAMMIHQRNILVATDSDAYKEYKEVLDDNWAGHSYKNVGSSHNNMISVGCKLHDEVVEETWF